MNRLVSRMKGVESGKASRGDKLCLKRSTKSKLTNVEAVTVAVRLPRRLYSTRQYARDLSVTVVDLYGRTPGIFRWEIRDAQANHRYRRTSENFLSLMTDHTRRA